MDCRRSNNHRHTAKMRVNSLNLAVTKNASSLSPCCQSFREVGSFFHSHISNWCPNLGASTKIRRCQPKQIDIGSGVSQKIFVLVMEDDNAWTVKLWESTNMITRGPNLFTITSNDLTWPALREKLSVCWVLLSFWDGLSLRYPFHSWLINLVENRSFLERFWRKLPAFTTWFIRSRWILAWRCSLWWESVRQVASQSVSFTCKRWFQRVSEIWQEFR